MLQRAFVRFFGVVLLLVAPATGRAANALPSWRDTPTKQAIVAFVRRVTDAGSPDFVPPAERIATFDNDGCLWSEKPIYFQLQFAIDRVRALAPEHPEWKTEQPFRAVLEGDEAAMAAFGKRDLLRLVMASHGGMTTDEFAAVAADWLATARHPRFDRPYTELTYRPMVELLAYLRASGFKTYIVSGGGIEFLRVFAESAYGVPPEQVIGSSVKLRWDKRGPDPRLVREPELDFLDDKEGKPVAIYRHIGRRPIFAAGNSDGDLQMLQYATVANPNPSFGLLIHHTDATREWSYDRESPIGRLNQALAEAPARGWTVVDMANDWRRVFAESAYE